MEMPNDHDLLIQIDTKLERVIVDVRELKDNFSARVETLETEKVDKEEYEKLVKRVDWVEKIAYGAVAIVGAAEFAFKYLLK